MGFLGDVGSVLSGGGTFISGVGGTATGILGLSQGKKLAGRQEQFLTQQQLRDIGLQKEFAKHGIQWKVEDAKNAGLHPLVALGANTLGYQPVGLAEKPTYNKAEGLGEVFKHIGKSGQGMGTMLLMAEELKGRRLDNKLKYLELFAFLQERLGIDLLGTGPKLSKSDQLWNAPGGSGGSGGAGNGVNLQDAQVTKSVAGGASFEKGVNPASMWVSKHNYKHGDVLIPALTNKLSDQMEDNLAFKVPFYTTEISDYWNAFSNKMKGPPGVEKWMSYWERYLPKNNKGFEWMYSAAGYFYQQRKGIRAADLARWKRHHKEKDVWTYDMIP